MQGAILVFVMLVDKAMKPKAPAGELTDLVRAVGSGDADALAELYRRVQSSIYAFALSRLGDRDQAAEVLHEVMLEVWRRARGFEGRSRALTWILGIARYKIIDAQRRGRRWRPQPPSDQIVTDIDTPTAFDRVDRGERRGTVRRALEALSDAHREVVNLAFYQDLSYPEIARLLEVPLGTVKTRMFHAKKALRRQLAGRIEEGAA